MATATRPRTSPGVVLEDVTWADYEAQLRIIGDRHIRVNYDDGRMEIMSPLVAVHTPALPNADSEQSRPVFFEKWNALTVQPGRPGA